jgi:hypothetical protein
VTEAPRITLAPLGGATDAWRFSFYVRGYHATRGGCARAFRSSPAAERQDARPELVRGRSPPGRSAA